MVSGRFKKLATDVTVNGTALLMFAMGGEERDSLDLPVRLGKYIPPKINASCKKIAATINSWPTTDKALSYIEFAGLFGFSESEALEAELAAAAVRIQAMSRKKQGTATAIERKRKKLEAAEAGTYTKVM
jgi:hypothetical protein